MSFSSGPRARPLVEIFGPEMLPEGTVGSSGRSGRSNVLRSGGPPGGETLPLGAGFGFESS